MTMEGETIYLMDDESETKVSSSDDFTDKLVGKVVNINLDPASRDSTPAIFAIVNDEPTFLTYCPEDELLQEGVLTWKTNNPYFNHGRVIFSEGSWRNLNMQKYKLNDPGYEEAVKMLSQGGLI